MSVTVAIAALFAAVVVVGAGVVVVPGAAHGLASRSTTASCPRATATRLGMLWSFVLVYANRLALTQVAVGSFGLLPQPSKVGSAPRGGVPATSYSLVFPPSGYEQRISHEPAASPCVNSPGTPTLVGPSSRRPPTEPRHL